LGDVQRIVHFCDGQPFGCGREGFVAADPAPRPGSARCRRNGSAL
jgi:hypothetical protein